MFRTILGRLVGSHLLANYKGKVGEGHLQSLIGGYTWRGILFASTVLYSSSPKFKDGLDQIIAAVTGG